MKLYKEASLMMLPTSVKDGKLYSIFPQNGDGDFTFSRGSNLAATRINEQGLIEKGRENLLLQSNQFDTTWTTAGIDTPTNDLAGYDGSSNAWSLVPTSTTTSCRLAQSISTSGVNTFSVYAKANGGNGMTLRHQDSTTGARFDLSNGTLGIKASNVVKHSIEDVGGGWYRCSVVLNVSITEIRIYVSDVANSYACTAGNGILVQDAQLEVGLVATDYIESGATTGKAGVLEDLPRLNWGDCPSLLLEPSRQNLFTYSEYVEEWSSNNVGVTLEENAATSPEGTQNATKIKEDNSNGSHAVRDLAGPLLTSGEDYTFSFFAKKGERSIVALSNTVGVSNSTTCWFDLENGQVLTNTFNSASIEDFGNGWFRCIATDTADAADDYDTRIYPATADNQFSHQGVEGYGIFVYGLQLEQGSYPTSYIPTHGTSVTRSDDRFENTNLADYLGTGTKEATFFFDFNNDKPREGTGSFFRIYTDAGAKLLGIKGISATNPQIQLRGYVGFTGTVTVSDSANNERHKVIFKVTGDVIELFYNGTKLTDTITGFSTYDWYELEVIASGYSHEANEITIFDTALSDNECINLTTI